MARQLGQLTSALAIPTTANKVGSRPAGAAPHSRGRASSAAAWRTSTVRPPGIRTAVSATPSRRCAAFVPAIGDPADLHLIVAGGSGSPNSLVMHGITTASRAVSRPYAI